MTFDEFLPHVLPYVPGCPKSVAIPHIIKAARAFCVRTLVWNVDCEPTLTVSGLDTYPIDLDDGQDIIKLTGCMLGSRNIDVLTVANGRTLSRSAAGGRAVWLIDSYDFRLYPVPTVGGEVIALQMAVEPSLTATEWPDDLAKYIDDIAHGAVATLAIMPKVEWRDSEIAQVHYGMYNARALATAFNVMRGFSKARRSPGRRFI